MKIGDPLDSSTTVGATISKEHAEKVLAYIKGAVKEGATVATGGQRVEVEGEKLSTIYFICPGFQFSFVGSSLAIKLLPYFF